MARIAEAELSRIKREISVERLALARGVKLKRHGADLSGLCPFHDDREPSLVISPRKNLWHCLGACQAGGSAIDWVMRDRGVSFRQAVELLRSDLPGLAGGGVVSDQGSGVSSPARPGGELEVPPLAVWEAAEDGEVLGRVLEHYHATLKASPEALGYLESRGLVHPELLGHFRLGYANRTLGYRLPSKRVKAGKEIRERLQRVGVLRKTGHEHFNGSLVVPVLDAGGAVAEMYGRKITPKLRSGTPLHLYLPGPHRGVFHREALAASKEVILCESLLDALTFWCSGIRNVTSAFGVQGFTAEMLEAFGQHGIRRVLIAFDRDDAGDAGASKVAERLMGAGIECFRVLFPRGMDANAVAVEAGSPAAAGRALEGAVLKSSWMGKGAGPSAGPAAEGSVIRGQGSVTESPTAAAEVGPAAEAAKGETAVSLQTSEKAEPVSELRLATDPSPLTPPSPVPAGPRLEIPTEQRGEDVLIPLGDRIYRVRGLAKNTSYEVLKVNLQVRRGEHFFIDTLELYSARHRGSFQKAAGVELGVKEDVIKKDLGKVLLKLEELQDVQIRALLEPAEEVITLEASEREAALELLRDPRLLERILEDFARCGVVGEETNKLVGYLAAVSRKLEEPLAVIIQSSSAAGKTSLMDAVLAFVPEEERVQYSAMTGQSLFYMGETNLSHKILAIVEEEGAERASYALKLLQSEGELTIASTGKDPQSGRLVTHEYRVEGPVMILLTTTAIDLDEELLNRCLVLSVDEGREQTRAIHAQQRQRRTLEGLRSRVARRSVRELHRNAQRLLKPLAVMNPYAPNLTFLDTQTRMRRDHEKYLTLIDAIALLHQHQREVKRFEVDGREVEYVEVSASDIGRANRLAGQVLGRSLDELPPQTRRFLELLDRAVSEACSVLEMDRRDYRFTRRDAREATLWSYPQVRAHLDRLVELEYVLAHRGGRGQSFVYELLYDGQGQAGEPFLMQLIDVEGLDSVGTTESLTAQGAGLLGGAPELDPPLTPH